MKSTLEKFLKIDRRLIFLALAIVLFFPIVRPLGLPNKNLGKDVVNIYNHIESLPAGSFILMSLDYDPATRPELHPQAIALVKHSFRLNHRIGIFTLNAGATGMIEEIAERIPKDIAPAKVYGKDYVIFPYQPKPQAVMTQLGIDMYAIYDKDRNGAPTREMEVMKGIHSVKDMSLGICVTGTALLDAWVAYVGDKYNFPMAGGVTAVSQPGYGPYLQTGQLKGLIGGMKGAADYESLINELDKGTSGIDSLSLAHILVIILIVTSNIIMLVLKYF
ncbi:MAG: hypothetical protein FD189_1424 [Elusimicrobia bacterium]|nr:MAG: hypothetical protein FD154_1700 [Elusimicrobiota bacterium]KAF0155405.1 MAG: hypothetical protein FD189_1424 [Elusimicrobiota bacterium]